MTFAVRQRPACGVLHQRRLAGVRFGPQPQLLRTHIQAVAQPAESVAPHPANGTSIATKVATWWWAFQTWRASKWLQLTVEGVHYLEETIAEACVIVAFNHTSSLDWYVAAEALRDAGCDNVYLLGDKSWSRNPLASDLKVIPVTSPKGFTLQDLDTIEERVRHHAENMEPVTFIAFPEGTVSATGSLQRFKIGTAYLASKLGCQVVPAFIHGTHQVLPRGGLVPSRHPVTVTFARPLPAPDDMAVESDRRVLDPERRVSNLRRHTFQKVDEELRQALMGLRRQGRAVKRPLSRSQRRTKQVEAAAASEEEGRWSKLYSALVVALKPVDWVRGGVGALLGMLLRAVVVPYMWLVQKAQEGGRGGAAQVDGKGSDEEEVADAVV